MTREDVKKFLPKLIAFAEGKTIQMQNTDRKWHDLSEVEGYNVIYSHARCRIKPEPREFHVNVHGTDDPPSSQCWFRVYRTREEAEASDLNNDGNRVECIRVREVLD